MKTLKTLNTLLIFIGLFIVGCQTDFSTTSQEQNPPPLVAQKYMPINFAPSVQAKFITEEDIPRVMHVANQSARPVLELLLQEEVSIEELWATSVNVLDDNHAPPVRAYLEQKIAMNVLDHARDHDKSLNPEHAGYFADLLLKNENANAHLIAYALSYIGNYWPDDLITSSAAKAADFAESWMSSQGGLHKTTPINKHEKDNAQMIGLNGAKSLQIQSLEISIEQLREM